MKKSLVMVLVFLLLLSGCGEDDPRKVVAFGDSNTRGSNWQFRDYPKAEKWKRNSLDVQVQKLLNNPKIDRRIAELNEQKTSVLMNSTKLNKRKLLETALQMLEDTNNPAERTHAVSLIKLLFQKEGMLSPETVTQVNIQNNNVVGEVSDYLNL